MIDTDAGHRVYNNAQQLQTLQNKIHCDWLASHKSAIDADIAKIPMTMTFPTAMTIYCNAVHRKHPPGAPILRRSGRRGIAEVARGRGYKGQNSHGGYGGGGRGGHGRRGTGIQNHPDQETIILQNRQQIQYHPSCLFSREEMQQMTQGQRDRLNRERAEYRQQQGLPST